MARHPEREELYKETGASSLVGAYQKVRAAVESSAGEVDQYPSTPFSENNAHKLQAQVDALSAIGEEIRAWHEFIWKDD